MLANGRKGATRSSVLGRRGVLPAGNAPQACAVRAVGDMGKMVEATTGG